MPEPRKIVCTEHTCGGAPRLTGTRLTCEDITCLVRALGPRGMATLHDLEVEDVSAALQFGAQQRCIQALKVSRERGERVHYCQGCTLYARSVDGATEVDE